MKKRCVCLAAFLMLLWAAPEIGAHGLSIGSSTTFSLGASTLNLSGDWSNAGTFTAGSGTVVFNGSTGNQTVANASGETFYQVTVNKAVGDVLLHTDVTVSGTLTITGGDVDLNGNILTLGSSGVLIESADATVRGESGRIIVIRDLNAPDGEDVAGLGAVITSSANLGATTITRGHAPQTGGGNSSILRYYDIAPANNSGLNATLVFHYDDSDLNGLTEGNLALFQSSDGGIVWTNRGGTVAAESNTVTKTGIDGFSRWTVGDSEHSLTAPEIDVRGNGTTIPDGDATPSTNDHTDFGNQAVSSGTVVRTFAIHNMGTEVLTLGSNAVSISGDADFTVTDQPATTIAAGGSDTFTISFDPATTGIRSTTVSVANDDFDENPYTFAIQGTGIAVPVVTTQAASDATTTTAKGNGTIVNLGYPNPAQHGVCWGASADPTTTGNKTEDGSVSATGTFTSGITGLSPSTTYHYRAYATNTAGTVYGGDMTFSTLPNPPSAPDLHIDSDTGTSGTDNITRDATPTFAGTAEANATVTVISSIDGILGTTTADGSGNWSYTPGTALTEGTHSITATVTNTITGKTSTASSALSITIDITAPAEPAGGLAVFENATAGTSAGTVTSTDAAAIAWSLDADGGGRFAVSAGTGEVTVGAGASFDTETEPTINITVRATDTAGNASTAILTVAIANVNEPPEIGGVFGDTSSEVIAGSGAQNVTGLDDATVSDADSVDLNGGFLTVTQTGGTTNGSWGVDGSQVTSGGDATIAAGETLSVSGSSIGIIHATSDGQGGQSLRIDFTTSNAAPARIQALLRALTYSAPTMLGDRTFTLTLNDNDGTANGGDQDTAGTFTITITPNQPVVSNLNGDGVTTRINVSVHVDDGGNAAVTDADSANFNGGNMLITASGIAGNFEVDGTSVTSGGDTIIAAGETVSVGGTDIGTIGNNGQEGNDLRIDFNENAAPALVQTLIRGLIWIGSNPGTATFDLTVTDAGVNAATSAACSFTVTAIAPEIDVRGKG
ncbi:MAG TPA: Ig-like domain-containing protein, partial [Syntrophales bacterium]|nr:Ig-like domain-containing protein [Syntrophales bacterium]